MADLTDVSNALVALIAQTLYPNGIGQAPVTGVPTVVYAGWPTASQLDADLAGLPTGAGRMHVTVFPTATEKNVTRYLPDWQTKTQTAATLALSISGQTITVSGTVNTPQNVAVLVNGAAYTYAVQSGDTLTSIATALAALIPGATNAGAVITVPSGQPIRAARAGGSGTLQRETKRQERVMQLSVWADTPDHRSATAAAIDNALSGIERIALPDGTLARLIYRAAHEDDMLQKSALWRRDLLYSVEYATTQTAGATEVVVGQENIDVGVTGADVYPTTTTVYQ
jgi:LysM repeat protein